MPVGGIIGSILAIPLSDTNQGGMPVFCCPMERLATLPRDGRT